VQFISPRIAEKRELFPEPTGPTIAVKLPFLIDMLMHESVGFLGVLISDGSRSVILLGPFKRSVGDADGVSVDGVDIRGNRDGLGSHQEAIDTAPGSSGDGTSTRDRISKLIPGELELTHLRSCGRAIQGSTNMEKTEMAGKTRAAAISPFLPTNDKAAVGTKVLAS
jgi:hypothetical protein